MSTQTTRTPATPFGAVEQVSDAQLRRYAELIYAHTGIRVSPQKKTLLSNRLRRRMRSTGAKSFDEYFARIKKLARQDPEWDAFIQEITTHETFLFRDESQWAWFRGEYLPALADPHPRGAARPSLRIWSAACSTGDEAYTAACCVAAGLDLARWNVRILGTDIGVGALEQAKAGIFGARAMRLVPLDLRRRFFIKAGDESWQAAPAISRLVEFRRHNLMEPLAGERPFDLVLLKNVLIYFNEQATAAVLQNVRSAVRPGGMLLVGMAEGVADMMRAFERIKPWLYRKPLHPQTRP